MMMEINIECRAEKEGSKKLFWIRMDGNIKLFNNNNCKDMKRSKYNKEFKVNKRSKNS